MYNMFGRVTSSKGLKLIRCEPDNIIVDKSALSEMSRLRKKYAVNKN